MDNFWKNIKQFLNGNLIRLLCSIVAVAGKAIDYLQDKRKDKIQQQSEKEIQKAEKKIDDACDKGGIDDLFDAAEELKKAKQKKKEAQ